MSEKIDPDISVIIPTYNCASYICEAIDSTLSQKMCNFEIIVVDDGSTDETKTTLIPYLEKSKINYIFQKNKGPGAARNTGIRNAHGNYICFLDADDLLLEGSLSMRANLLKRSRDVYLVFSDYHLKPINGDVIESWLKKKEFLHFFDTAVTSKKDNEVIFNNVLYSKYFEFTPHPIWTGTVMIRKKVIEHVGFFRTDISFSEDREYWMRIAERYIIGFIDEPLSIYRRREESLTEDFETLCQGKITTLIPLLKSNSLNKKLIKKRIGETSLNLGRYYYRKKRKRRAKMAFLDSVKYDWRNKKVYLWLLLSLLPVNVFNLLLRKFTKR